MTPNPAQIELVINTTQGIVGLGVLLISIGAAWGTLKKSVSSIESAIREMKPDIKNVRERFGNIEERVNLLWADRTAPTHSPRQLNELGNKILNESGIKEIVERKKDELLKVVREKNLANPYDADIAIRAVMNDLPSRYPDILDNLKSGAFRVGADIDTVLFVGSIHLRNLIFKDLGFSLDGLDESN